MNKKSTIDLFTIYKNYLYSLKIKEEYGSKYGDTNEIIKMYEEELKKYKIKKIGSSKLSGE